ncbi:phage portal protein [Paracoccus sp. KR1-242]|uniref:phage portal protein n=1 Tax=Paracoccus sp. KR1-242 TaxID=3410028 RepID=UPI003C02C6E3
MALIERARSLATRIKNAYAVGMGAAGSAAFPLPYSGGNVPASWPWNFWQQGRDPISATNNPTVAACTDAYAHTIASLKAHHVRQLPNGGRQVIRDSPAARFLRTPNGYQTRSDFMLNFIKSLLYTGNAYGAAMRDDRNQIKAVHILHPNTTRPLVDWESQTVYYAGFYSDLMEWDSSYVIPARDMLHVRLYTPRHPLIGVSPIENLALDIMANNAIMSHQALFFTNMSRPSGIISVPDKLNRDQMQTLREAWYAQSQQLNSGGVPILAYGAKWEPMVISSQDSQLVEAFRLGVEEIARAFRVPLPMIGDIRYASYNNVEQLISNWLAMGLGFHVEHLEACIARFFELPRDESIQFDVDGLLRTDFQARVDALTKGITGGLYSPNEARNKEGLPSVPYGDEPRLQAQVVPLSQIDMVQSAPSAPAAPVNTNSADPDMIKHLMAEVEEGLGND